MKCKHLKLIMELIFIFILPLLLLLPSVSIHNDIVYDNNGNFVYSDRVIDFQTPFVYEKNNIVIVDSFDLNFNWEFSSSTSIYISLSNLIVDNYLMSYDYLIALYDAKGLIYIAFNEDGINSSLVFFNEVEGLFDFNGNGIGTIITYSCEDIINYNGEDYYKFTIDTYANNNWYWDFNNGYYLKVSSESGSIIFTILGKIKLLFTEFLDFNNSPILDLFISYNFLWLMMFISWHFLYSFFDFIVHLVDRERRRE